MILVFKHATNSYMGDQEQISNVTANGQEKVEEIKELIKEANEWISICQSNLRYFGEMYNISKLREKVNAMGSEAGHAKDHVEWLEKKSRDYNALIEYLGEVKAFLDKGTGTLSRINGKNLAEEMREKINSLY